MPRRIQVLPDALVNQIAAGEVVERPASVVKELAENAMDAGATRVDIALRNGGKTEIRVSDDGSGMGREDAILSLDRHATSKLRSPEDLVRIATLGFRGEALPSIASVSRLVVETADRDGAGTRLQVSGGRLGAIESCARRQGTTVTVRNLFFNVPARAKFLRATGAETRAVSDVVTSLALASPGVAFRLESNGKTLLDLEATDDVRARIAAVWGERLGEALTAVVHHEDGMGVHGAVERPHHATPGSRRTFLFVNGRPFTDRTLLRAADRAYRTTVAEGVQPSLFLFLEVPSGEVDVNVHPAKAEVRFRDRTRVERLIENAIRAALAALDSTPAIGVREPAVVTAGNGAVSAEVRERHADRYRPGVPASPGRGRGAEPPPPQMSFFVSGASKGGEGGEAPVQAPEPEAPPVPMWQLHNRYILAETRQGLVIVDQHAAHERVLYEELMRDFAEEGRTGQHLLFPITLRLSPAEFTVVEDLAGILSRAGFEIEPFGGNSVLIRAVPDPHPHFDAERCIREMITELTQGSELVNAARNQHERVGLSYACKAAIKSGQKLSREEMAELFDRLFATELPYHDVHGRSTVVQLSLRELDQRFGRS
jgi:DNA mismatch repair protein MutL